MKIGHFFYSIYNYVSFVNCIFVRQFINEAVNSQSNDMQKVIKYILFVFISIGIHFSNFSQVLYDYNDISIFFGDKIKSNTLIQSLEKTKSEELLCVQNKPSFFQVFSKNNSNQTFDFITDYTLPKSKPIKLYGEGEKTNLINYATLGDQILALSYRATFLDQTPLFFYHNIDPNAISKVNHGFPISSFNGINRRMDLSQISMISSKDQTLAAIVQIPNTRPDDYTTIKYFIIEEDFALINENEFIYPYPTKEYEPLDYFILDKNHQLFLTGHFVKEKTESTWNNTHRYYKQVSITKITENQLSFENFKSDGKFFIDVEAYPHKDGIIITGLYSSFIDGQVEGVFIATINERGRLESNHFIPFSQELIGSIKRDNTNQAINNVQSQTEYKKFNTIDFKRVEDGFIFTAEFNAMEYRYGGNDVPGATNLIDTYYWSGDLIVCKIDNDGKLIWDRRIPKIQRSINDGGYYISSAIYCDSNKVNFFFNDNLSNYNENGNYSKDGEVPYFAQFNSSKNTIAHVSIQLSNGKVHRKKTIGKKETSTLFVPRLSVAFTKNQKLMIYGQSGKKHRIGSVSFSE